MTDNDFDTDDELRAVLRGGDPAGALPPADRAALASLLEDIMGADLDIRTVTEQGDEGSRSTGTRRRNPLTWLVAAAAVAAIAAGGGFVISGLGGDGNAGSPEAGPKSQAVVSTAPDATAPVAGETTQLKAGGPVTKCVAQLTPEMLAGYDQAFEGTVTAIDGTTITLQATDVYNGDVGETVQVKAPPAGISDLLNQAQFQVGGSYLVSAFDGAVSMCGASGPATVDLKSLYNKAFVR
jgi:hypothetical protein